MGKYTDIFRNLIHNSNAMKKPFEKILRMASLLLLMSATKGFLD